MTEQLSSGQARLDAAVDAMRATPAPSRDEVALVAARAVLANAPAARAGTWAMRAAAVLVVGVLATLLASRRTDAPRAEFAGAPTSDVLPTVNVTPVLATRARPIVFELDAPGARSVQVLGDFNNWSRSASRMQRGADGHWRLTTLLPPGRYVYAFLVDGRRFEPDPARDRVEDRDFGVTGSELVVSEAP
ncbi:MAG: isoamylase early set domain-containing protein [Gemmatimonadota bacterium]